LYKTILYDRDRPRRSLKRSTEHTSVVAISLQKHGTMSRSSHQALILNAIRYQWAIFDDDAYRRGATATICTNPFSSGLVLYTTTPSQSRDPDFDDICDEYACRDGVLTLPTCVVFQRSALGGPQGQSGRRYRFQTDYAKYVGSELPTASKRFFEGMLAGKSVSEGLQHFTEGFDIMMKRFITSMIAGTEEAGRHVETRPSDSDESDPPTDWPSFVISHHAETEHAGTKGVCEVSYEVRFA
jgi:hypothetical protein